jgi:dihydroorotate dehydrogenase electron transfer subunit
VDLDERRAAARAQRGTIALEDAEILAQIEWPGDQYVVRLRAPRAARRARPGTFAHIGCDPAVPLRRPLSIMRADANEGWLEFLYRPHGLGLRKLAARRPGDRVSVLAPIGRGFTLDPARPLLLALGGGVGIPPMIFLAEEARRNPTFRTVVLMGSEVPFPFELAASGSTVPGALPEASRAVALLESWGVPSRLASNAGLAGCHRGYVTDLARAWLTALAPADRARVQLYSCGPHAMLEASARLARELDVPCEVALEEFMACGVGGCAGCNVRVMTADGPAMKRVCVDGPVFDARVVFHS